MFNGHGDGPARVTLSNWTGIAYKIPRIYLDELLTNSELTHGGIYFLVTDDDDITGKIYVGKVSNRANGKSLLNRVKEHVDINKKSFTDVIFLTTLSDNLGASELSYLEYNFYQELVKAKRYEVTNAITPSIGGKILPTLSDPMDEYINNSKTLMSILGYELFTPIDLILNDYRTVSNEQDDQKYYYNRTNYGNEKPKASYNPDGTVTVHSGSKVRPKSEYPDYTQQYVINIYNQLVKENKLIHNKLVEDVTFNSPSTASSFVGGVSSNGWVDWKDINGISLKDKVDR